MRQLWRHSEVFMQNEKKEPSNRLYIGIIVGALAVCAAIFLRSCGQNGGDGADRAADRVRGGIEQSVESNRELQSQISGAAATAGNLASSLDRSAAAVEEAAGTAASLDRDFEAAADAISKCQRIVDDIKRRNETGTAQP